MQRDGAPARAGLKYMTGRVVGTWAKVVLMLAVLVLAACSEGATEPLPGPKPVASVSIAPKSGAWTGTLRVGESVELAARALASDGSELPSSPISWSTTNGAVVTVSGGGLVLALAEGTVQVRASVRGTTGVLQISVVADPPPAGTVASVQVSPGALVLQKGATRQYAARAYDVNGGEVFGRTVVWSSRAPGVASITSGGVVKALSAGYTDIIATVDGVSGAVGLTVTPPEPEPVHSVIVSPSTASVYVTQYTQLRATVVGPTGGTLERDVVWISDDPTIALVGVTGMVLGVSNGRARIRAVSENVSGQAFVEVRNLPSGPVQTYDLRGTHSLPVPFIEIGPTQWVDAGGYTHPASLVVTGGTLSIDGTTGRYEQSFHITTYLATGSPTQPPVDTQTVTDGGTTAYDYETGTPVLVSDQTPGLVLHASPHGAGELMIPQSVLGRASQAWIWVVR